MVKMVLCETKKSHIFTQKKKKTKEFLSKEEEGTFGRRTDFFLQEDGGGGGGGPQDDFLFVSRERIFEKGKKELKNTRFRERGRTREREREREREKEREREMRGVVGTRGRGMHNDAGGNFNRRGRCGDAGGDEDEVRMKTWRRALFVVTIWMRPI